MLIKLSYGLVIRKVDLRIHGKLQNLEFDNLKIDIIDDVIFLMLTYLNMFINNKLYYILTCVTIKSLINNLNNSVYVTAFCHEAISHAVRFINN